MCACALMMRSTNAGDPRGGSTVGAHAPFVRMRRLVDYVCVHVWWTNTRAHTHTHIHTHIHVWWTNTITHTFIHPHPPNPPNLTGAQATKTAYTEGVKYAISQIASKAPKVTM